MVGTGQLYRKFATIFAGHHPLQMLDDGRNRSNVFPERFGAIDDAHPCLPTQELVVCGLVGVLKPSPPANIENQNGVKSTLRSKRIAEKLIKRISAFQ